MIETYITSIPESEWAKQCLESKVDILDQIIKHFRVPTEIITEGRRMTATEVIMQRKDFVHMLMELEELQK